MTEKGKMIVIVLLSINIHSHINVNTNQIKELLSWVINIRHKKNIKSQY